MEIETLYTIVSKILKKTEEEQKQSLRSFTKIPLMAKIKVFDIHKKTFYNLKNNTKGIDLSILSYIALIMAIDKYQNATNEIDVNVINIRSQSIRKSHKRDKLLTKWALIKDLKNNQKLSFREIEKYLKKYHKLAVVHSTIYDMWKTLENNKTIKSGEKDDR